MHGAFTAGCARYLRACRDRLAYVSSRSLRCFAGQAARIRPALVFVRNAWSYAFIASLLSLQFTDRARRFRACRLLLTRKRRYLSRWGPWSRVLRRRSARIALISSRLWSAKLVDSIPPVFLTLLSWSRTFSWKLINFDIYRKIYLLTERVLFHFTIPLPCHWNQFGTFESQWYIPVHLRDTFYTVL